MDSLEAEAWADHATQRIWAELRTDVPPKPNEREIAAAIRAAYARGYCDALGEAEPLTIREAMERELILSVLVPVL